MFTFINIPLKKLNKFYLKECIELIKSNSKDIYYFELFINQYSLKLIF